MVPDLLLFLLSVVLISMSVIMTPGPILAVTVAKAQRESPPDSPRRVPSIFLTSLLLFVKKVVIYLILTMMTAVFSPLFQHSNISEILQCPGVAYA